MDQWLRVPKCSLFQHWRKAAPKTWHMPSEASFERIQYVPFPSMRAIKNASHAHKSLQAQCFQSLVS